MKAYRYLSEEELNAILADDNESIGAEYDDDEFRRINTHRYKDGVRYLHFFKDENDIKYIQKCGYLPSGRYYICEFDIPFYVLLSGYGKGYYGSYGRHSHTATEFKVPAHLMKGKYLKSYKIDENRASLYDFFEKLCMSINSKYNANNPDDKVK